MKKLLLFTAITLGLAASAHSDEVRSFEREFDAGGFQTLQLDIPLGEVRIDGSSDDRIEVEVIVECEWRKKKCTERADKIDLVSHEWGDKIALEIDGLNKWRFIGMSLDVRVTAPAGMRLELDMGVGEVEIAHFENDLTVDLGVGELTIKMNQADVYSVDLDTGLGEASLRYEGGELEASGLFSNELRWNEGDGHAVVRVELGIGEIDVRLR